MTLNHNYPQHEQLLSLLLRCKSRSRACNTTITKSLDRCISSRFLQLQSHKLTNNKASLYQQHLC